MIHETHTNINLQVNNIHLFLHNNNNLHHHNLIHHIQLHLSNKNLYTIQGSNQIMLLSKVDSNRIIVRILHLLHPIVNNIHQDHTQLIQKY